MLISHSKKFIFIHIYKVAGTSISRALSKHCDFTPSYKNPWKKAQLFLGIRPNIFASYYPSHTKAKDLKDDLPRSIYMSYYKFAFVRNPWDWQVSLYKYALSNEKHHQHDLIKKLGSFEKYIDWRVNSDLVLQKEFVYENDELIVDFVGRFERLQQDFEHILEQLNLPSVKLGHHNRTKRGGYREYYTKETQNIIAEAFKEDITLFGYNYND